MEEDLIYQIGITLLPGVGDKTAKKLIAYCGSSRAVFYENKAALIKIPGIGIETVNSIFKQDVLKKAEVEAKKMERKNIQAVFYTDKNYPNRLKHCEDSPVLLFMKGDVDFNNPKVISVVGTRRASEYGKSICRKIIKGLSGHGVLIVSGLAYGIDICAHRAALANGLPTVAVLAHGLDMLYPPTHYKEAEEIKKNGAVLSEYKMGALPDKTNFPERNRIVAGMSDAVIVIESPGKGGSLITADIANSYNRDVFAVPGNIGSEKSIGCNKLIKAHKAALIQNVADIEYVMMWEKEEVLKKNQQLLLREFSKEELKLFSVLKEKEEVGIQELALNSGMPVSRTTSLLLGLELKGVVRALPGNRYRLV